MTIAYWEPRVNHLLLVKIQRDGEILPFGLVDRDGVHLGVLTVQDLERVLVPGSADDGAGLEVELVPVIPSPLSISNITGYRAITWLRSTTGT